MGLAIDTNEVCEFVFSTDKDKPESQKPVLLFRFPSHRNLVKICKCFDEGHKLIAKNDESSVEQGYEKYIEGSSIAMVGWRNMGTDFSVDNIGDVLTTMELIELQGSLVETLSANEADKKKHKLQSLSNTVESVKEIVKAAENVQVSANPVTLNVQDVMEAPLAVAGVKKESGL